MLGEGVLLTRAFTTVGEAEGLLTCVKPLVVYQLPLIPQSLLGLETDVGFQCSMYSLVNRQQGTDCKALAFPHKYMVSPQGVHSGV